MLLRRGLLRVAGFVASFAAFAGFGAGVALGTPGSAPTAPPCDPREEYDEYLQYDVSYLGFDIGTQELYFSGGSEGGGGRSGGRSSACGAIVMETFPNIGFLRVYTEYFAELDRDGYFRRSHTWNDEGDEWGYAISERSSVSNRITHRTGLTEEQFGDVTPADEFEVLSPDGPAHDAVSFIRYIRDTIGSRGRLEAALFDDGSLERIPVTVVSRSETVEVGAFEEPQPSIKVEVELDFEAIHGLRDVLTVHFAKDAWKTPLYAEARIVIGRVRLELAEYRRGSRR